MALSQIINRAQHWKCKSLGDNQTLCLKRHENVYKLWRNNSSSKIYHKNFKVFPKPQVLAEVPHDVWQLWKGNNRYGWGYLTPWQPEQFCFIYPDSWTCNKVYFKRKLNFLKITAILRKYQIIKITMNINMVTSIIYNNKKWKKPSIIKKRKIPYYPLKYGIHNFLFLIIIIFTHIYKLEFKTKNTKL